MDEKQIKEILQSQRSFEPGSRFGCPEENKLAAFVDGQLTVSERSKFERHMSNCQSCLAAIGFLSRSAEWDDPPEIPPYLLARARRLAGANRRTMWRWQWAVASAAAACILLALSFAIFKSRVQQPSPSVDGPLVAQNQQTPAIAVSTPTVESPRPAPTRSVTKPTSNEDQSLVVRGNDDQLKPRLMFPSNGATVRKHDLHFRWEPVEDATSYTVRLVKADGSLIREIEIKGPELILSDDVELAPDTTYYVRVVAHTSVGRGKESDMVRFRVARE